MLTTHACFYSGLREYGALYIAKYLKPVAFIAPLNVLDELLVPAFVQFARLVGNTAAMLCVQDYRVGSIRSLERVLAHHHSIIAHLNWIAIFTGFHSFGLYIQHDALATLNREGDCFSDEGIPFRPVVGLLGSLSSVLMRPSSM